MINETEKKQETLKLSLENVEIDFSLITVILFHHRKLIFRLTLAFTFVGLIYSLLASPLYFSEAIISPKEPQKGGTVSTVLSQFGGLGGMVATQLGMGNNNLDRIEIIAKSRGMAETVIRKNDLLPILFSEKWDSTKGKRE